MFNIFKKKSSVIPAKAGIHKSSIILTLKGLDCPSCAVDLDLTIEDLTGVIYAKTNYAKSEIKVSFNPSHISLQKIKSTITDMGYQVD